jgi:hypothetical protein
MLLGSPDVAAMQSLVLQALGLLSLGIQVYALVDVLRAKPGGFVAAGKQTKRIWVAILGVSVALGFVSINAPLNIFNLIAVVAAAVYLVDVRPAVRGTGGSGGGGGPYGPW